MSTTAIEMLQRSWLRPNTQMQALGDIDLQTFHAQMRDKAGIQLVDAITSATISRTIEGASTLTISVEDDLQRTIQKSGRLGRQVDVEVDGLFFTLVAVSKTGRSVTLTFEDREINVLRYYATYMQRSREHVTRAEFVRLMLIEPKELKIRYYIPELTTVQPISDVGPTDILVTASGKPISPKVDPPTADATARTPGISIPAAKGLTVKGAPATVEQLNNANTILQVGAAMELRRKILVCSIMTAIDESDLKNLGLNPDGSGSIGIFQQIKKWGWPASGVVATDAAAFFQHAQAADVKNPNLTYNDLCQTVQNSATPTAYGKFYDDANAIVNNFGVHGGDNAYAPAASVDNNQQATASVTVADASGGYFFTRGQITQNGSGQNILQPENSWQCITRLAQEVNWRAFCVSGVVYFISDADLMAAFPYMTISEDSQGIDWIDYNYDEGKRVATVSITAHLSRWSAPPGSVVKVFDMGIPNGLWLVNQVDRSLYDTIATISLKKVQPVLPEPTTGSSGTAAGAGGPQPSVGQSAVPGGLGGPLTETQKKIIQYAQDQIGTPYVWGGETPGQAFDCSGLCQAAYAAANISIPRTSQAQWSASKNKIFPPKALLPADLVFFNGSDGTVTAPGHVGIYIGNGKMIVAPHSDTVVQVQNLEIPGSGYAVYVGATRDWNPNG
jgi:cell wall-associated NlpC family hydrolase